MKAWIYQTIYGSSTVTSTTTRAFSIITILILILQWFVSFPYELQRMMVRFLCPLLSVDWLWYGKWCKIS